MKSAVAAGGFTPPPAAPARYSEDAAVPLVPEPPECVWLWEWP